MSTSTLERPPAQSATPEHAVRDAPPQAASPRGVNRAAKGAGFPVLGVLFVISLVIPNYFSIAGLRLAPFLVLILLAFFPLAIRWMIGGAGRVQLPDFLILGSSLWSVVALFVVHGTERTEAAGIVFLQTFGAYLIGRCAIRSLSDMEKVMKVFVVIVAIFLPFAVYEAFTGTPLYLRLFAAVGTVYSDVNMEPRMGLDRVQGAFEHPILFGIFSASGFAILLMLSDSRGRRAAIAPLIAICTFLSLSTGALLSLVIQIGCLVWGFMFRKNAKRWRILMILVAIGYIGIDILSNRTPFEVFVSYLTFNTGSAYNRVLIWTYGSAEVMRYPVFGIGYNDWERPVWLHSSSFDMFWLLIAMRYGVLASAMLGLACLLLMIRAGQRRDLDRRSANLRTGLVISLVALFTAIWSVHLWNATYCWMMFLVGCLGWLAEKPTPAAAEAGRSPGEEPDPAAPDAPPARRSWLSD